MLATTADERSILEAWLDFHRDVVVGKVSGLTAKQAGTELVPSGTTPAGLLRHLAVTEREWFWQTVGGEAPLPGEAEGDPDTSWDVDLDTSVDTLVEEYRQTCARSRALLAKHQLDDLVPHRLMGPMSVRWVVVHMIEETARHAGQADILREQIDGATGVV